MNRTLAGAWLTAMWVLLWGDLTPANLLGGAAAAAVLLAVFPAQAAPRPFQFRIGAAVRFLAFFVVKLIQANMILAWEVMTPGNRIREGIVAIPVSITSDGLTAVVANSISLTPGTLTLEVDRERRIIYVHVLHLHDLDTIRRDLHRFEELALMAFGSPEELADFNSRKEVPHG